MVEWIAMTVPGFDVSCQLADHLTHLRVVEHGDVDDVRGGHVGHAPGQAGALLGQRRHRLGADVVNGYATGPFGHLGSHRGAHVAQPDVAELRTVAHDRMTCPPSTLKICPVIHEASSDNRNRHIPTRSSGVPIRDSGSPLLDAVHDLFGGGGPIRLGVDGSGRYRVDPDVLAAELTG